MANRLFLSLSDEELQLFESAREKLGMNRSQYVRYLISGQKEIRPPAMKYQELIKGIADMDRNLKIIAMKESLSDQDRQYVMTSINDMKTQLATSGQLVQK